MTGTGAADGTHDRPNPFVGARPFRLADAGSFHARQAHAHDVAARWLTDRVVVLHGPAAVGKTSLLHAGVVPRLAHTDGVDLLQPGRLSRQPGWQQDQAANGYELALLRSWGLPTPTAPASSITSFVRARLRRETGHSEPSRILAMIDQVEELFTDFPARQAERDHFIDELAAALIAVPALRLLLIARDDHLDELRAYEPRFSPHPFSYIPVTALHPQAAIEAVTRPFADGGRPLADEAAARLVERLRTITYTDAAGNAATAVADRVEPLFLQIVCAELWSELWSALPAGTQPVSAAGLDALGDADRALARFYDSAVDEVQLETGMPQGRLRGWIESAFVTEHGTRGSVNRGASLTAGVPNDVAEAFAQRHLLAAERRASSTWYQLINDRLIAAVQQANQAWWAAYGSQAGDLAAEPATPAAFAAAAQAALLEGNFPSAYRFARLAAARYRESGNDRRFAHALMLQGDIARTEGNLSSAGESFRAALSTFAMLEDRNSTVRMLSALADVHFAAGDYHTAADLQSQAVGRLPTDVSALIGLGYAQWYGGSPANAEATFSQAINWDLGAIRAFAGRGQVRAEMREYAAALADLDYALAAGLPSADEPDARSARALALTALGRADEAERDLAAARAAVPGRARTLLRASRIAAIRGQAELAHEELERALSARPPLPAREAAAARRLLAALDGAGTN
jgi:tetratricopeptide (TPR) repeat protein